MRRTDSALRKGLEARLADLERRNPEWQPWPRLLRETLGVLDDAGWETSLPDGVPPSGTPLLDGRELSVDAGRVRSFIRRLVAQAPSLPGLEPTASEAVRLVEASIRQDPETIRGLALATGVDPEALITVGQLAAVPLLHACGRQLQDRVPAHWPQGYCPICASWPILAELRGLDRTRRLRCGRCGGDWRVNWLCCAYCGERDHEQLGSLVPDDRRDTLKVETCARCRGYLKSVATLQGIPPFELLLRDLETVELDLVAVDRGYSRPQGSGFTLDVRVTARRPHALWRFGRSD